MGKETQGRGEIGAAAREKTMGRRGVVEGRENWLEGRERKERVHMVRWVVVL